MGRPKPQKSWTPPEVRRAIQMRLAGQSVGEVAATLGRSKRSVSSKLRGHDAVVRPLWTPEQDAALLAAIDAAAGPMGRTRTAAVARAAKLCLGRKAAAERASMRASEGVAPSLE